MRAIGSELTGQCSAMNATTGLWVRRLTIGAIASFLLVASIGPKLVGAQVATESLASLGWPAGWATYLGLLELACLVLFLVPRTRLLGALVMTAFLGGTVATHLRVGNPMLSHTLFGVYLGALMWGAVLIEEPALRRLLPLRPRRGRDSA
ncbi:MAG TPA: DoxX family protein [Steroidobacteraceae bacterium]|nr:DoxX family protein [Steroidobacteraceae bacterium]